MTGRGRPRKCPKSPEVKKALSPRCPEKDFTEEKQNGSIKEQKPKKRRQKKPNHADEKPPVQSTQKEETSKHFTEEINTQQRTPTENSTALAQGAKPKTFADCSVGLSLTAEDTIKMKPEMPKDSINTTATERCAGRAKLSEQFEKEIMMKQPETPKKTREPKRCAGKAKSPEKVSEEAVNMQPETPKKTREPKRCAGKAKSPEKVREEAVNMQPETPKKTREPKRCAGKAKSPEKVREEAVNMQPETTKCAPKAWVPQYRSDDSTLSTTLKNLKIKREEKGNAAKVINEIKQHIITHLKRNTECFKDAEPLPTGSYYENVKISNPDEFDVMLSIPAGRVTISPFGGDGAFYSVELKRGNSLKKFQENDILSASKLLEEFRNEVKKCVKVFKEWEVTRKKGGCPAVTLERQLQSVTISLDVVLCLMVKSSWPQYAKEGFQIDGWLGTKVKQDYKRKPYYLVPKYEGRGNVEDGGVLARDVWRISFSHVEKAILLNHGSEKTCCEKAGDNCCRKDCLKLLKHLLSLLKENNSNKFDKFCSYHAKTTLLHACCSRTKDSEWRSSSLNQCFIQLLEDFVGHLEKEVLPNFFIPDQNLFSGIKKGNCMKLARCIKEECDNGFPIFKGERHNI